MQFQVKTQNAGQMNALSKSSANQCRVCGRPLSDPISVELGIGPICRISNKNKAMQEKSLHLFKARASFSWTEEDGIISIVDLSGNDDDFGPTVTNDIDNVLRQIALEKGHGLQNYRIIYRDTQGIWDGVHVTARGGARFYSINEKDYESAKAKLS